MVTVRFIITIKLNKYLILIIFIINTTKKGKFITPDFIAQRNIRALLELEMSPRIYKRNKKQGFLRQAPLTDTKNHQNSYPDKLGNSPENLSCNISKVQNFVIMSLPSKENNNNPL